MNTAVNWKINVPPLVIENSHKTGKAQIGPEDKLEIDVVVPKEMNERINFLEHVQLTVIFTNIWKRGALSVSCFGSILVFEMVIIFSLRLNKHCGDGGKDFGDSSGRHGIGSDVIPPK